MDDNDLADVWCWEDTEESPWERWATRVEALLGHDLDGTFRVDGYSLDTAHEMYLEGLTPTEATARIIHDKRLAPYDKA